MFAEEQGPHEGVRPSVGPVMDGDELLPMMEVFKRPGGVGLSEPVGYEQGKIEAAVVKTAFGDGGVVELVNADRDQLDRRSGMTIFKEPRFLGKCVFKVQHSCGERYAGCSCCLRQRD